MMDVPSLLVFSSDYDLYCAGRQLSISPKKCFVEMITENAGSAVISADRVFGRCIEWRNRIPLSTIPSLSLRRSTQPTEPALLTMGSVVSMYAANWPPKAKWSVDDIPDLAAR